MMAATPMSKRCKDLHMNRMVLVTITLLAGSATIGAAVSPVTKWNEVAVTASLTAGEGAVTQSRTLAIVQIPIHDALNSIDPRYERYAFQGGIEFGASPEAAIAVSGHDALGRYAKGDGDFVPVA